MQKLRTIIIENDAQSLSLLMGLIADYCPELEVIASSSNIQDATKKILNFHPDLVFLDIELDDGSGFEVLYQIPDKKFKTIVTSGYSHYAFDAFKFEITHYLLKPVCIRDLRIAVERTMQNEKITESHKPDVDKTTTLSSKKKIQVATNEGIKLINLCEIEYFQADGSYTNIYLLTKEKLLISRHLKNFEMVLTENNFYRIGRTHIINMDYIKAYNIHSGGTITMQNGDTIIIPRRKKDEFIQYFNSYIKVLK
ncbi:MAG: response regulator transcription factor [Bacteroidales bacterium]|nr:response regulator transcription factor [Bacteroidales bacterium]